MSLEEIFKNACDSVVKFSKKPPDADMLELYGLYKQANFGDNKNQKPSDEKGKKKWDAWNGRKGMAKNRAMELYIEKFKALQPKFI